MMILLKDLAGGQGIEEEVRQQFTGLADKFKPKKDKSK
jgi:hypothetical protein